LSSSSQIGVGCRPSPSSRIHTIWPIVLSGGKHDESFDLDGGAGVPGVDSGLGAGKREQRGKDAGYDGRRRPRLGGFRSYQRRIPVEDKTGESTKPPHRGGAHDGAPVRRARPSWSAATRKNHTKGKPRAEALAVYCYMGVQERWSGAGLCVGRSAGEFGAVQPTTIFALTGNVGAYHRGVLSLHASHSRRNRP
jgi:hypothetical protein